MGRGEIVNDIHSRLNATRVARVLKPTTVGEIRAAVRSHPRISVAGGRHAMGGQQFGTDSVLLDTRSLNRVLGFDRETGRIHVEAGIQWPELMQQTLTLQANEPNAWGIAQKQSGADRLSIGGALSSNIHGRGLTRGSDGIDAEVLGGRSGGSQRIRAQGDRGQAG